MQQDTIEVYKELRATTALRKRVDELISSLRPVDYRNWEKDNWTLVSDHLLPLKETTDQLLTDMRRRARAEGFDVPRRNRVEDYDALIEAYAQS